MLKGIAIGYLGNDCQINVVNGRTVINANLAHTETWIDSNGVKNQRTVWISLSYWNEKTAIAQWLKKGTQIYVEGDINSKIYTPQNGQPVSQITMRVHSIQLLGGPQNNHQQPQQEKPSAVASGGTDVAEDSMPF